MEENLNGNEHLQDSGQTENNNSDFFIPDEYKEEGWTKVFDGKTGEELKSELFKSYDNSQKLIGKKVEEYITQTDLKNLDNYEEIKEALQKQIAPDNIIPEKPEDYELSSVLSEDKNAQALMIEDETLGYFGDKFKEIGISKEQAQGLFKAYVQHGLEMFNKYTDADELDNDLSQMFRGNKEQKVKVESLIKEFLPKEDLAIIENTVPNKVVEMFYKVGKGLLDKYGFKESGAQGTNPAQIRMSEADKNREYDRLAKELEEIDNNPYQKVGDRDKIVNQMRNLFK